jgi:hypothetical protein
MSLMARPAPVTRDEMTRDEMTRYRRIFPSYSHRDRDVVRHFEAAVFALGDRYLQDVLALRSGERWNERLLELIGEADVFQLFWSSNSMRSPFCRQEWERALALRRSSFIRPLYWEDPFPEDSALGLPPKDLRDLHFARVLVAAPREPTRDGLGSKELPDEYWRSRAPEPLSLPSPAPVPMSAPPNTRNARSQPRWIGTRVPVGLTAVLVLLAVLVLVYVATRR